jgi:hypothetical protein
MKNSAEINFTWTAQRKGKTPGIATWFVNYSDNHLAFFFSPQHALQWFEKNGIRLDQTEMSNQDFMMSMKLVKERDTKYPMEKA